MNANEVALKIKAIMSVPRLGFNDHYASMAETLNIFGIPIAWYTGAYWEKCVESSFEDCLDQVDAILALDYDTMATPQHMRRMLETFCANPHIDALAANQPRRGTNMPLWTVKGVEGRFESNGLVKANTAHFGFTLIRTAALKRMPKPWFLSIPSTDGGSTWRGKGHRDADINFWVGWEAAGNSLYIEQSVCIGHIEAMIAMFEHREIPSIAEQIQIKRAELDALQNIAAQLKPGEDERQIELFATHIGTGEWRKRFAGDGGMSSLGEQETR